MIRDERFLARIRQLPCLVPNCGVMGCDAAHLKTAENAGVGIKPSDEYVVPLCHHHHMRQHSVGSHVFWERLGIEPLWVAARLYTVHQLIDADVDALEAMRSVVLEERFAAQK